MISSTGRKSFHDTVPLNARFMCLDLDAESIEVPELIHILWYRQKNYKLSFLSELSVTGTRNIQYRGGAVGFLVGLLVAHHVRDPDPEVGVGAVVGVLQGVGVGVAGPRALPPTQLKAAQQLPPSGLLQRHLLSKQRRLLQRHLLSEQRQDSFRDIYCQKRDKTPAETSIVRKETRLLQRHLLSEQRQDSCRDISCQNRDKTPAETSLVRPETRL